MSWCLSPPALLHPLAPAGVGQAPLRQRDDMPEVQLCELVPTLTVPGADTFLIQTERTVNSLCNV